MNQFVYVCYCFNLDQTQVIDQQLSEKLAKDIKKPIGTFTILKIMSPHLLLKRK